MGALEAGMVPGTCDIREPGGSPAGPPPGGVVGLKLVSLISVPGGLLSGSGMYGKVGGARTEFGMMGSIPRTPRTSRFGCGCGSSLVAVLNGINSYGKCG